jgi:hypothetical protein
MVGQALKGEVLIPLERLEVNNIHSCGGCVILEDAAKRHGLGTLLAPLSPRSAALAQAMIYGGLLFPPSVAPFHIEWKSARLASYCGLDPEHEHFDLADLETATRDLDQRWPQIYAHFQRAEHRDEIKAIALFQSCQSGPGNGKAESRPDAVGLSAGGVPIPLMPEAGLPDAEIAAGPGAPLLILDEAMGGRLGAKVLERGHYLVDIGRETLNELLHQLNHAQLLEALRTGKPFEVRHHHGERYILGAAALPEEAGESEAEVLVGSLKDLASIATPNGEPHLIGAREPRHSVISAAGFHCVRTNLPAEKISMEAALEWAERGRAARLAFSPVEIVLGRPATGEGLAIWRNHRNLQFLTHWLRCCVEKEWREHGETRPAETVLRDLQEIHRVTLTVEGAIIRKMAGHPSQRISALLTRLDLWRLFIPPAPAKSRRT